MTSSLAQSTETLPSYLEDQRKRFDARLDLLVPPETERPSAIHKAMRYSLFAGGKRIRPVFCKEAAKLVSDHPTNDADSIAASIELVHTYSLIHDDLPALDNDDYRRGKLTCHKVFGEANAILAGDALLTLSFEVLANLPETPAPVKTALIAELARSAGTVGGMIAGQVLDLEATNNPVTPELVEFIHRSKTGALIRASLRMGAIGEMANDEQISAITKFGECAGLAFQVADDILDVESSSESLGKTAGKDAAQNKVTYPSVHGLDQSKKIAADLIAEASAALAPFGERSQRLLQLADFLVTRKA